MLAHPGNGRSILGCFTAARRRLPPVLRPGGRAAAL